MRGGNWKILSVMVISRTSLIGRGLGRVFIRGKSKMFCFFYI
jgi:hypothetical protein